MFSAYSIGDAAHPDGNVAIYAKYSFRDENDHGCIGLFFIDACASLMQSLVRNGDFYKVKEFSFLITHMHPDHIGSLGSIIFHCKTMGINVRVGAPISLLKDIQDFLRLQGVTDDLYDLVPYMALVNDNIEHIQAVPAKHVDNLKCFSYLFRFQYEDNFVYYSGDGKINWDIIEKLKTGKVSEMYQDVLALSLDYDVPHATLEEMLQIPEDVRHKIYCIHLCEFGLTELLNRSGFQVTETQNRPFESVKDSVNNALDGYFSDKFEFMCRKTKVLYKDPLMFRFAPNSTKIVPEVGDTLKIVDKGARIWSTDERFIDKGKIGGPSILEYGSVSPDGREQAGYDRTFLYVIKCPKGMHGVEVKYYTNRSFFAVILEEGQKFKITDVDKSNESEVVIEVEPI